MRYLAEMRKRFVDGGKLSILYRYSRKYGGISFKYFAALHQELLHLVIGLQTKVK